MPEESKLPQENERSEENERPEENPNPYLPRFSSQRLSRRQWNWALGMMVFSVLLIAAVIVFNLVRVPYVSLSPGSVYSASGAIVVDDGVVDESSLALYNSNSDLGYVTVGVSQKLSLWRFFFDSLDSRIEIFKEEIINRGGSRDEADQRNAELMQASQQSAVTLALEFLGLTEITLFPP